MSAKPTAIVFSAPIAPWLAFDAIREKYAASWRRQT